ncbi:hypothetical protein [Thalassospira sp. MCCC 1A03138]|uniref:hypothetical protein n=1 Tax=Thalassospira sp. MCCC 1A03138 TaxID=1470576 RepID=UPI000A1D9FF7
MYGVKEKQTVAEKFFDISMIVFRILLGVWHTLANPERSAMKIVGYQPGCYLVKDDIVRFEDYNGRK